MIIPSTTLTWLYLRHICTIVTKYTKIHEMDISISIRLGNPNDCQRLVPGADHAPERSNSTWKCIATGAKERDEAWILAESNSKWEELIVSSLESCWNYVLHGFSIVSNIYCTHYSTVLYSLIDCKIDMLNLVLFEVSFASRTSKESNESHVRPAKCKTGAPKQWMLRKPQMVPDSWSLESEIWANKHSSFSKQAHSPSSSIIKMKMTYIVMWEFSKMMDPKKMSTLGFRDPFVAILLGNRSIFGTYASTARRHCWTPPRHKLSERSLRWGVIKWISLIRMSKWSHDIYF